MNSNACGQDGFPVAVSLALNLNKPLTEESLMTVMTC